MAKKDEKAATPQSKTPKQEKAATAQPEDKAAKQTAAMTAAKKIAKGIFDASPAMKNVHIASDGTAFYALNDAKNYARTLHNKEVISLNREDVK